MTTREATSAEIKTTPIRLDNDEECQGCGNRKTYRGKPAESLVCCRDCWGKLPRWAKEEFTTNARRAHADLPNGTTIWQHRISILLQWMHEINCGL